MRKQYAICSTLALALLCLTSVGCYSPEFSGAGGFKCDKNGSCPEGFVCAGSSGSKVCVKEGSPVPDIGSPDTSADTRADGGSDIGPDASSRPVKCSILSGSAATIASKEAAGGLGLAFDPEGGRLYASYLIKKGTTSRILHVVGGAPNQAMTQIQPTFDIKGGGAGTAIAARNNQWVAVFQRGNMGSQQFVAVRSSDKGAAQLNLGKEGHLAGINPDVLLSADGKTIVAVHQYKEKLSGTPRIAELVRVAYDTGAPIGNAIRVTPAGYSDSGYANMVIVDEGAKPQALLYGTVAKKSNKDSAAVITKIPVAGGSPQQLPVIGLGEALVDNATVGLAPGFHLTLARKLATQEQVVTYRKPQSSDDTPVPGLTRVGRPRIAALDRMVAILVIDELLNPKLIVLDENNEVWSAPFSLPDKALDTQLVAVPGKPGGNEVVFHAIYRAPTGINDSKVLHQPVVCVRQ